MKKIIFTLLMLVFSISAYALEDLDFRGGYISDNAQVISSEDYKSITGIIKELKRETTAEIAVVTVNSLQGQSIEDTAVQIGREYGVGAKNINNGVVVLVSPHDRVARIEVGMGLEDELTNDKTDIIMNEDMVPYFAKSEYSKGIYRGVATIADLVAASYGKTLVNTQNLPDKPAKKQGKTPWWLYPIAFILFLFKGRGKKGAFGGGGGFSGGHGSTGRW